MSQSWLMIQGQQMVPQPVSMAVLSVTSTVCFIMSPPGLHPLFPHNATECHAFLQKPIFSSKRHPEVPTSVSPSARDASVGPWVRKVKSPLLTFWPLNDQGTGSVPVPHWTAAHTLASTDISAGITGCCDSSTPANSLADTSQKCPLQPVCLLACGILT